MSCFRGEHYRGWGVWVQTADWSSGIAVIDTRRQGIRPGAGQHWIDAVHVSTNPSTAGLLIRAGVGGDLVGGRLTQTTTDAMIPLPEDWDGILQLEIASTDTACPTYLYLVFRRDDAACPICQGAAR